MIVLHVLVPFDSNYLCEAGFSHLVNIKTKNRNILDVGRSHENCFNKRSATNFKTCCKNATSGITLAGLDSCSTLC